MVLQVPWAPQPLISLQLPPPPCPGQNSGGLFLRPRNKGTQGSSSLHPPGHAEGLTSQKATWWPLLSWPPGLARDRALTSETLHFHWLLHLTSL